jgi:hypothetical protein
MKFEGKSGHFVFIRKLPMKVLDLFPPISTLSMQAIYEDHLYPQSEQEGDRRLPGIPGGTHERSLRFWQDEGERREAGCLKKGSIEEKADSRRGRKSGHPSSSGK